jgi:maltooligosyltrehalose trehalohydrolase
MTLPPVMELLEQEMSRPSGWELRRGALLTGEGVTFKVWAPRAREIVVHVEGGAAAGDHPLTRVDGERGVWSALVPNVVAGDRYGYRIDGGRPLSDPVSRSQPDGVHGLSEVVDPTQFAWQDGNWVGMSLPDFVIYELHVGTFTPEGTFDAIIPRLGQLAALGVTAISCRWRSSPARGTGATTACTSTRRTTRTAGPMDCAVS